MRDCKEWHRRLRGVGRRGGEGVMQEEGIRVRMVDIMGGGIHRDGHGVEVER